MNCAYMILTLFKKIVNVFLPQVDGKWKASEFWLLHYYVDIMWMIIIIKNGEYAHIWLVAYFFNFAWLVEITVQCPHTQSLL